MNFYHETGFFQWLARHQVFENTTLGVIVVNALWMSIDTDCNKSATLVGAHIVFIFADISFFSYFSGELFIRFAAFKQKKSCLKDAWFIFDTTLVSLYAFDPFISIIALVQGGSGMKLPLTVLRLFRLARLSRLIRMLRSLPELMVMVKGMASAAASVGYTLGLLLGLTYVFAIALVNLVEPDSDIAETYFSTVPESMHNLILYGTFLDALSDFLKDVQAESVPCFILSWVYIMLAALTIMNMLIGVLCEVISAVAAEEKESAMVDQVREKFESIVTRLDDNHDGILSWKEFQLMLAFPEAVDALEQVNVDPESMVDMAEDFFFEDGEEVEVTFEDFMGLILDMRGGNAGTVKDIMNVGKRINHKFITMKKGMEALDTKVSSIDSKLEKLLAR